MGELIQDIHQAVHIFCRGHYRVPKYLIMDQNTYKELCAEVADNLLYVSTSNIGGLETVAGLVIAVLPSSGQVSAPESRVSEIFKPSRVMEIA